MKTVAIENTQQSLADSAREAQHPVVVTEKGTPVAVVIAIENADLETVSLSTNPRFLALIEHSRTQATFSTDEVKSQLGL